MTNPYMINIRLTHGHSFQVTMEKLPAMNLLRKWMAGEFKPDERVGEINVPGPWGVRADQIVSLQLFDVEEIKRAQIHGGMSSNPALGSGPIPQGYRGM